MTTLLLLAVFLVAGLAVHTLLLWGLARLFRLERATFLRALLIVVLLSVLSIGILAGVRVLGTMPAAMTLVISACQLAITLLCFWGMARLILHASAGKAALVTICHLAVAAILGAATFLGLTQMVRAYVVPTNAMAPAIAGYHFSPACLHCRGAAIVSALAPGDEFIRPLDEPRNGVCTNCRKISEFQNYQGAIHSGDRIVCNRLLTPARWDIITFRYPPEPSKNYVMRLVGLPGETVTIEDKAVWIDGVKLALPPELSGLEYARSPIPEQALEPRAWALGPSEYFVLGDFKTNSSDSRDWGPVPAANIESVATIIYWPPERWQILR